MYELNEQVAKDFEKMAGTKRDVGILESYFVTLAGVASNIKKLVIYLLKKRRSR